MSLQLRHQEAADAEAAGGLADLGGLCHWQHPTDKQYGWKVKASAVKMGQVSPRADNLYRVLHLSWKNV